jgi:hypothetical protein
MSAEPGIFVPYVALFVADVVSVGACVPVSNGAWY